MYKRQIQGGYPGGREPENKQSWVWAALAGLGVLVVIVLGVALALNGNDKKTEQPPPTAQAQIPDLSGSTEAEAKDKLSQAGFTNVTAAEPTEGDDCKGEVAGQTPTKGTTVPVDTAITYTICNPPDKVTVPSGLVGGTQSAAETALKNNKLVPIIKEVDSSSPKGQVVKVDHQGESVAPGTNINVYVSNSQLVKMPDVLGKTQDVATALLQAASLNVEVSTVQDGGDPGTVVKQSKKAGTNVKTGTQIVITVVAEDTGGVDPSESASPDPTDTSGAGGGTGTDG